jgi:diguanylate cyclase (GGDEF)-like protein/PAS domain S-box-containing protein
MRWQHVKPEALEDKSTTSSFPLSHCPLSKAQLENILDDAWDEITNSIVLSDLDGHSCVEVRRVDSSSPVAFDGFPDDAEIIAPVRVRGATAALLRVIGPSRERVALEQITQITAARIAEPWNAAIEIESLAGEIVQLYDALHLIYELGDTLSSVDSAMTGGSFILEKIMAVLSATYGEFRLSDRLLARVGEPTGVEWVSEENRDDDHRLSTELRSGGKRWGSVVLYRSRVSQPFASSDSKLLDGVGTLVAGAVRGAQLYDELRQHAETLRQREVRLRAVLDSVADGIITIDEHGIVDSFNHSAEQIFGYTAAEVVGQPARTLLPSIYDGQAGSSGLMTPLDNRLSLVPRSESFGCRKDGTPIWMDLAISEVPIGEQRSRVVSVRDVTARKHSEEMLQHQALYDALTDLPNRNLLHHKLEGLLLEGTGTGGSFATLLMDLDRFKEVNDTIGHQYGDLVLREVGTRLRRILRQSDLVARLGGDEFAVLLPEAGEESASRVAEKIGKVLEEPFEIDGYLLSVGVSIGIAIYPAHGEDPDALLRRADIAMYVAKRHQSGYVVYQADEDHHTPTRLQLMGELRSAIANHQLVLHYQPQVNLKTRSVSRVEALVRWQHPTRGLIEPSQFIALAEQSGMMVPLTRWVLRTALHQCQMWLESGHRLSVAVNLSAQNLRDPWLPSLITELLRESQVPPELLQLEITESTLMADPARALETLRSLSRAGVRISIDDFGTGYSSLSYLKRLPVNEIKIDRSFIFQMAGDSNDEVIVRSIIGLGHDLGLTVVAEGVEESMTWDRLSHLNCDVAQGFYMSRPRPEGELAEWLSTGSFG